MTGGMLPPMRRARIERRAAAGLNGAMLLPSGAHGSSGGMLLP